MIHFRLTKETKVELHHDLLLSTYQTHSGQTSNEIELLKVTDCAKSKKKSDFYRMENATAIQISIPSVEKTSPLNGGGAAGTGVGAGGWFLSTAQMTPPYSPGSLLLKCRQESPTAAPYPSPSSPAKPVQPTPVSKLPPAPPCCLRHEVSCFRLRHEVRTFLCAL